MRSRISLALALSTCVGVLAGCDGSGGPVLVPDGGPADTGPPPIDAPVPEVDTERPRVSATTPAQGARGVGASAAITVTFSEAMDEGAGTAAVRAGGVALASATSWSDDATTLTITPSDPLPSEARVEVTLDDDFADVAGNTLALPYVLAFETGDFVPPVVVSSDPAQGATELSARIDAITIRFDEQMDNSAGTLALEGGEGTLGTPSWTDGRTLRAPVSGLAYETTYRVTLAGFEDAAGNALDASVYLDEGAIVMTTGADDDAPRIADSVPSEGQVNVALRGTPSIVLVFDEPMDTSAGTATLHAGGLATVLAGGTWSNGDRRLSLPVAGRLYPNAPHSVVLEGFRDVAGNALDSATYLGDGALDFDTGADATVPVVVFSYPNEGSTSSDHHLATIEIAFDRAMEQSVESVAVHDGTSSFDAPLTWNLAGTRAYADVSERIHAGRSYTVDLRAFVDLNGDPVDPDAPYLGDGVLDFSTRAPRGDQCRDELRVTEATGTTAGGGYEWVIPETTMVTADNGRACQFAGGRNSYSPDAVIFYRKTTADGASGGRYLHVRAETGVGDRLTLAIYRDSCGEHGVAGAEARVSCQWERYRWDEYLDVGPGDYYVWVANVMDSSQPEITVQIEEVDAVPAGESCANPYVADPSSPVYTAPAEPGGEHTFTIPAGSYTAADFGEPGAASVTCDSDLAQGTDFVIALEKQSADTLISIVAEGGDSGFVELNVEALSECRPDAAGVTSYACESGIRPGGNGFHGPRRMTFEAPAGPFYVWGANQLQNSESIAATIRVQEFPRLGSSCADAIPIAAAGSLAIEPSSLARLDVPSCMAPVNASADRRLAEGITWYRLTSTAAATRVFANAAGTPESVGSIAVIEAETGRELGCSVDASQIPLAAFLTPGDDVCIAVRNESGVTGLEISQHAYDGVRGVPTDVGVTGPFSSTTGNPISIASALWLRATPSTFYLGTTSSVVHAPRAGGVATQITGAGSYVGYDAIAIGEAIISLDDSTSAADRLLQIVAPSGMWLGPSRLPWDGTFGWPNNSFRALGYDGTSLFAANVWSSSIPAQILTFPATGGDAIATREIGGDFRGVAAITADSTYFYWLGTRFPAGGPIETGVYRMPRAGGTPQRIASIPVSISGNSDTTRTASGTGSIAVDTTTGTAGYLYARGDDGAVHVVADPGGAAPLHLGAISTLGGNRAMDYLAPDPSDPTGRGALFVIETGTVSTGRIVRLD